MKAKHRECPENSLESNIHLEPEIVVVEDGQIESQEQTQCEGCDFASSKENDLETHEVEKHENCEIKLEVFLLFMNVADDVHEKRKKLIDKLEDQDEVSTILKVYVNKNDAFIDEDNLKWHSVDVTLTSKYNSTKWKETNFRRQIFQKCCLWDTYSDYFGEMSRENVSRRKEENRLIEMRAAGYLV